ACEPYLFRQVELIRPKVIATLGNHATKQLSGKETGITRVHGQEQQLKVGALDVLLYPLYHPAAALYTPAMLKVLEEDFARLPGSRDHRTGHEPDVHGRSSVPGQSGGVPPRSLPLPGSLGGRVGRSRALLPGRDLLRRVARVGGRCAPTGAGRGTFVARGPDA